MRLRSLPVATAMLSIAFISIGAQSAEPTGVSVRRRAGAISEALDWGPSRWSESTALRPYAPLVSAVVPGGGQIILGDNRFVAYLAVEVLAWWKYRKDTREQADQEALFKDIARRVARSHFSATLPDADWAYYEQMRDFLESGAYSMTDQGPLVPETDPLTYNGSRWQLALATHSTDLQAALAQYQRVAIRPEFRWSWRNAQLQYDIFKRTTDSRNDAYHAAVTDLMILGANHVLSMVDAFVTFRLQVQPEDGRTKIGASLRW